MSAPLRFAAFVSYRHADVDRRWATWLHRALEGWRTPRSLVNRHGIRARVGRVFRDEEELSASGHLSSDIEEALRSSEWLVVVCSPRAVASPWVDREIAWFREHGRADRVLALLVEGEPSEAFPAALREIRPGVAAADEHLAADVRRRPSVSERDRRRHALLRLVSTMLGVGYDDLRRREASRRRRRLILAGAALATATLAMAGVTAYALARERAAREARAAESATRARAENLTQFMLVDLRAKLVPIGRLDILGSVVEKTREYYARTPSRDEDDETRMRRVIAFGNVATVMVGQGDLIGAENVLAESLAIAEGIAARSSDASVRIGLPSTIRRRIADARQLRGDGVGARPIFVRSLADAESLFAMGVDPARWGHEAASSLWSIARIDRAAHRFDDADRGTASAIARYDRLVALPTAPDEWRRERLLVRFERARLDRDRGRTSEALARLAEDLPTWRELLASAGDRASLRADLASMLSEFARALIEVGRSREALSSLREARELLEALVESDPTNAVWRHSSGVVLSQVSELRLYFGEPTRAAEAATAAIAAFDAVVALPSGPEGFADAAYGRAEATCRLASALHRSGEVDRALELARSVDVEIHQRTSDSTASLTASTWIALGHSIRSIESVCRTCRPTSFDRTPVSAASALATGKPNPSPPEPVRHSESGVDRLAPIAAAIRQRAEGRVADAVETCLRVVGDGAPAVRSGDRAASSDGFDVRSLAWRVLAEIAEANGDFRTASNRRAEEAKESRRRAEFDPDRVDWARKDSGALAAWAVDLARAGDLTDAIRIQFDVVIARLRRTIASPDDVEDARDLVADLMDLSTIAKRVDRRDIRLAALEVARPMIEALAARLPKDPRFRSDLGEVYGELATIHLQRADARIALFFARARLAVLDVERAFDATASALRPAYSSAWNRVADCHFALGDKAAALDASVRASSSALEIDSKSDR